MTRLSPADLLPWCLSTLGVSGAAQLEPVSGDASARRYFRLRLHGRSYIAVDSPPQSQKNAEFVKVRGLLAAGGIRVPEIYAADLSRGYLLLSDVGERQLLQDLDPHAAEAPYQGAFAVLLALADIGLDDPGWPRYDEVLLDEELNRFVRWFAEGLLDCPEPAAAVWETVTGLLTASALEQPAVLVHRDFHSRNLMPQADGALAVIDFQDAVIGPLTYDLVSLLRDCYIRWPAEQVEAWALDYLCLQQQRGQVDSIEAPQFLRWFDLMGLQRHIKVLGTFARLYLRDDKPAYLQDLPLVIRYVREILAKYRHEQAALAAFHDWFEDGLMPAIRRQPWSAGP